MPAISKILISNRALYDLGCERISSFTDGSKAAGILSEIYDDIRDEVNEAGQWKFSRAEAELAVLTDAANPSDVYGYAFQLPADLLKIRENDLSEEESWTQQGDLFLTNAAAVSIVYTKRVTDEGAFQKNFVTALAARLKMDLAYPMTGKASLKDSAVKEYELFLSQARSFDSQSGAKPKKLSATSWTRARL